MGDIIEFKGIGGLLHDITGYIGYLDITYKPTAILEKKIIQ